MDKDRVDFSYEEIRPGAYAAKPNTPLQPGEYAFIVVGGGSSRTARMFDFSVQ